MHPKIIPVTIAIVTILSGVMLWWSLSGGTSESTAVIGTTEEFLGIVISPLQASAGDQQFRVSTTDANVLTVKLPTAQLRDCVAYAALTEYKSVVVGAQVAIRGERHAGNLIIPCAEASHFVRVLSVPAPIVEVQEPSADLRAAVLRTVGETYPEAISIAITEYEARVWSDSCLGLGGPAESCLNEPQNGYWLLVEIDGRLLPYRSNERGSVVRLE